MHRPPIHKQRSGRFGLHDRLRRFRRRFHAGIGSVGNVLVALVYIFSLAVVVCLLLYAGFDTDAMDKRMLVKVMHWAQAMFVVNVAFNLVLRFRQSVRESLFVKKAADILLLLTLIPVIWPYGDSSITGVLQFFRSRYFFFTGMGLYAMAELSYGSMQLLGRRTNPSLILAASFLFFILIGSFVLMLPRCTVLPLHYIDALFMASSAVSLTGLCTVDVATVFSPMGWLVIGILMQIGALGVLTFTSFFALFFSGRASIYNQLLMRDFIYSKSMGGLLPVILYILLFTLTIEAAGAVGIYLSLPDGFLGTVPDRVVFSAFHSVSAFCNAGFTTLPAGMADSALMAGNQLIYYVMTILILAGGIGFPNLVNFKDVALEYLRRLRACVSGRQRQRRVHVFDVNTRLVMVVSGILFAVGFVAFYVLEYDHAFAGLSTGRRLAQAVFCSATVRTAGFSTYGPADWLGVTMLIAMFLMWVGCASQSMGGGIKVNAFAAVVLNLVSLASGQRGVVVYNRTIAPASIRRANAVVFLSVSAIFLYSCLLMLLQPELPMKAVMFEAFSAITTIGMSLGITPELSDVSKILICTAMFLGRVGIISVLMGLVGNKPDRSSMLPADDIIIN